MNLWDIRRSVPPSFSNFSPSCSLGGTGAALPCRGCRSPPQAIPVLSGSTSRSRVACVTCRPARRVRFRREPRADQPRRLPARLALCCEEAGFLDNGKVSLQRRPIDPEEPRKPGDRGERHRPQVASESRRGRLSRPRFRVRSRRTNLALSRERKLPRARSPSPGQVLAAGILAAPGPFRP